MAFYSVPPLHKHSVLCYTSQQHRVTLHVSRLPTSLALLACVVLRGFNKVDLGHGWGSIYNERLNMLKDVA